MATSAMRGTPMPIPILAPVFSPFESTVTEEAGTDWLAEADEDDAVAITEDVEDDDEEVMVEEIELLRGFET
jgi:hypothetical protein